MRYALINGIILDGTEHMEPSADRAVIIEDGRIKDIVLDTAMLSDCKVIDLKESYILPGLINLHVHLASGGKPPRPGQKPTDYKKLFQTLSKSRLVKAVLLQMTRAYARTELMSGVTTIRTVGGILDLDARIRDEIRAGKKTGPRILAANTGISVPGGHFAGSIATEAESPDMAREHVRKIAATKPDLIKLMITGGVMDASEEGEPGVLRMAPEIVKAACEEAHQLGFKAAAHVESPEGVRVALENGVDTIEHGAVLTEEMIRLFKERGAAHICTISPALPYAVFDLKESNAQPAAKKNGKVVMDGIIACAKACRENGIPVGLGNDTGCPFVLHYNFWRELCYYHTYAGASEKETLYTATLGNAKIAGIDRETGSVEKGKCADLIILRNNPLEDLSALRNVSMVIAGGKLIRNPKIRRNRHVDVLLDRYMG